MSFPSLPRCFSAPVSNRAEALLLKVSWEWPKDEEILGRLRAARIVEAARGVVGAKDAALLVRY